MRSCKSCNKEFSSKGRHLDCSACRNKKRPIKERVCPICSKKHLDKYNKCSPCRFQQSSKVRKERKCILCKKLHRRHGSYCNSCNRIRYNETYKRYDRSKVQEKRLKVKLATIDKNLIEKINEFYKNCPKDCDVDHIIPLKNKDVSGLHVPWNLQYLPKKDNNFKRNKFDFTYENRSWRKV